jgi:hypothetical protein
VFLEKNGKCLAQILQLFAVCSVSGVRQVVLFQYGGTGNDLAGNSWNSSQLSQYRRTHQRAL